MDGVCGGAARAVPAGGLVHASGEEAERFLLGHGARRRP